MKRNAILNTMKEYLKDRNKNNTLIAFLIIEALLYIAFTGIDLFAQSGISTLLKYVSILLCLLFSVRCAFNGGDRIVPFALFCTALADFFLLVINEYYLTGLLFFIAAQIFYLIRLDREAGKLWLPARIVCALLAVPVLFAVNMMSPLNLAAVLYFSLLLVNMAVSWMVKTGRGRTFAFGLSLFVLCDLCVGIFNLGGVMPAGLFHFSEIGMWLFYLPSQVLIVLSGKYESR